MIQKIDPNGKPQARRKVVLAAGGAAVVVGAMVGGVLGGAESVSVRGGRGATKPAWQEKPATSAPATQGDNKPTSAAPVGNKQSELSSATAPRMPGKPVSPTTRWSETAPAVAAVDEKQLRSATMPRPEGGMPAPTTRWSESGK